LGIPNLEELDLTNVHRVYHYASKRANQKRTYGWLLKVQRNRKQLQRFYMDHRYNNVPALSLAAAMMERDEFIESNPSYKKLAFRPDAIKNTTLGVSGVHFSSTQYDRNGHLNQHASFCATFHEYRNGKKQLINKAFSIEMYGFKDALRLAIRTRKEWEMQQLEKMKVDPVELRLAGYDYLDEEMAYQKVMSLLDSDLKKLAATNGHTNGANGHTNGVKKG
jgi:hypothetical protein